MPPCHYRTAIAPLYSTTHHSITQYTGVFTTMYEYDNPLPPPYHRPIYLAMVGKRVVDLYLSMERAASAVSKFTDGQVIEVLPGDDPTTALEAAMPGAYVCWW